MWLSTLPLRFRIILEKNPDSHERRGIAVQWNNGMKHNNTLLFGLMLSAQVKQFQSCLGGFLDIPSTSSNEEEMSCSMTQYRAPVEIQTHNLAIKSQ